MTFPHNDKYYMNLFTALDQEVALADLGTLTSLTMRRAGEGWQAVIKCERNGTPRVAFADLDSWYDLLAVLPALLDAGVIPFYPDRYAPKRRWQDGGSRERGKPIE